jgi:Ca2+-transporting ATPase
MLIVFTITFVMQIIISEFLGTFFKTQNLDIICWIKIIFVAFSVILLSEIYKFLYRLFNSRKSLLKNYKNMLIKNKNNA